MSVSAAIEGHSKHATPQQSSSISPEILAMCASALDIRDIASLMQVSRDTRRHLATQHATVAKVAAARLAHVVKQQISSDDLVQFVSRTFWLHLRGNDLLAALQQVSDAARQGSALSRGERSHDSVRDRVVVYQFPPASDSASCGPSRKPDFPTEAKRCKMQPAQPSCGRASTSHPGSRLLQSIRRNPMAAGMLRAIVTWGTAGAHIRSRQCTTNAPAQPLHRRSDNCADLPWLTGLTSLLLGVASFHSFRPGRLESLRRALAGTIHGAEPTQTTSVPLQTRHRSQVDTSEVLLRCFRHEADCNLRVWQRLHPRYDLGLALTNLGIGQHPQIDSNLVLLCNVRGVVAAAHCAWSRNITSGSHARVAVLRSSCMPVTAERNVRDKLSHCVHHMTRIISNVGMMTLLCQCVNGECVHEAPQGVQRDALYWPFDMPYQRCKAVDLLDSQTGRPTGLSAVSSRPSGTSPIELPSSCSKTAADSIGRNVELHSTVQGKKQVAARQSNQIEVECAQEPASSPICDIDSGTRTDFRSNEKDRTPIQPIAILRWMEASSMMLQRDNEIKHLKRLLEECHKAGHEAHIALSIAKQHSCCIPNGTQCRLLCTAYPSKIWARYWSDVLVTAVPMVMWICVAIAFLLYAVPVACAQAVLVESTEVLNRSMVTFNSSWLPVDDEVADSIYMCGAGYLLGSSPVSPSVSHGLGQSTGLVDMTSLAAFRMTPWAFTLAAGPAALSACVLYYCIFSVAQQYCDDLSVFWVPSSLHLIWGSWTEIDVRTQRDRIDQLRNRYDAGQTFPRGFEPAWARLHDLRRQRGVSSILPALHVIGRPRSVAFDAMHCVSISAASVVAFATASSLGVVGLAVRWDALMQRSLISSIGTHSVVDLYGPDPASIICRAFTWIAVASLLLDAALRIRLVHRYRSWIGTSRGEPPCLCHASVVHWVFGTLRHSVIGDYVILLCIWLLWVGLANPGCDLSSLNGRASTAAAVLAGTGVLLFIGRELILMSIQRHVWQLCHCCSDNLAVARDCMGLPSVTGAYLLGVLPLLTVFGLSMWSAIGSTRHYFFHPSVAAPMFGVAFGAPILLHTVPFMCYWLYPDWFPQNNTIWQLCCCPGASRSYGDTRGFNAMYAKALHSVLESRHYLTEFIGWILRQPAWHSFARRDLAQMIEIRLGGLDPGIEADAAFIGPYKVLARFVAYPMDCTGAKLHEYTWGPVWSGRAKPIGPVDRTWSDQQLEEKGIIPTPRKSVEHWLSMCVQSRMQLGVAAIREGVNALRHLQGSSHCGESFYFGLARQLIRLHCNLEALHDAIMSCRQRVDRRLARGRSGPRNNLWGMPDAYLESRQDTYLAGTDAEEVRALSGAAVGAALALGKDPIELVVLYAKEMWPDLHLHRHLNAQAHNTTVETSLFTHPGTAGGNSNVSGASSANHGQRSINCVKSVNVRAALACGEESWDTCVQSCMGGNRTVGWAQPGCRMLHAMGGGSAAHGSGRTEGQVQLQATGSRENLDTGSSGAWSARAGADWVMWPGSEPLPREFLGN